MCESGDKLVFRAALRAAAPGAGMLFFRVQPLTSATGTCQPPLGVGAPCTVGKKDSTCRDSARVGGASW